MSIINYFMAIMLIRYFGLGSHLWLYSLGLHVVGFLENLRLKYATIYMIYLKVIGLLLCNLKWLDIQAG
ncbi:hypothetical protein VNO80_27761 [Phaseolus coccineus]|uniref:Uncharacterized protein n=1 Tax=Phaseolus coccineus TaxID=3886 RepID=A0AAN9QHM9_PHACN